jgi:clan AA aspartic protease (TIGR02281 family)
MSKKLAGGTPRIFFMLGLAVLSARALAGDAPAPPEDVFKEKGLKKIGFLLVTADEAKLHATATWIHALKSRVTSETMDRAAGGRALQAAEDAATRLGAQLVDLKAQMEGLKGNASEYNKRVDAYNATLQQYKTRRAALEDLRKRQSDAADSQSKCTEVEIEAADNADAILTAYAALADDLALTSAIASYNKTAPQPVKLGPSGNCSADIAYLHKCMRDMAAEGVPVRMAANVPLVQVLINGKTVGMLWDSGAASVFLSAESAEELGIRVTDRDETVETEAADGHIVRCKRVTIAEVRVGPFKVKDVQASIAPKGGKRGMDLLGGAFQRHFQARLDAEAGVLHLTQNPEDVARQQPPQPTGKAAAAVAAGDDVFGARGLTVAGNLLVGAQEAEIHKSVLMLRGLKTKVASEAAARATMSRAVQNAADAYSKAYDELNAIGQEIDKHKDNAAEHDKLVEPYNYSLKQAKARWATLEELRKKMGRMNDSQSTYIESALDSARKAEATIARNDRLTRDAATKEAIAKYNKTAASPIALGHLAEFAGDAAFLKQTVSEIAADGIPFRIEGGVPNVEVTINGKTIEMIWDSGASYVSFSAETAAELGLHAGDSDETVTMTVADGKQVQCKVIVVPSIRVGGYVAENVRCIIDPKGSQRSPNLLGGTFQSRFLCRLDSKAGVIHLTPGAPASAEKPGAKSGGN